jgi:hypothetical protein
VGCTARALDRSSPYGCARDRLDPFSRRMGGGSAYWLSTHRAVPISAAPRDGLRRRRLRRGDVPRAGSDRVRGPGGAAAVHDGGAERPRSRHARPHEASTSRTAPGRRGSCHDPARDGETATPRFDLRGQPGAAAPHTSGANRATWPPAAPPPPGVTERRRGARRPVRPVVARG